MKRGLLLGLLALVGAIGGVVVYFWQQTTSLPSWYTPQSGAQSGRPTQTSDDRAQTDRTQLDRTQTDRTQTDRAQLQQRRDQLDAKIASSVQQSASDGRPVNLQLSESEITDLFTSELTRKATGTFGNAVKGVNTTIKNGKLESGAVVNLADAPSGDRTIANMIKTFPELGKRSIYIGIEGRPIVQNGQLRLDKSTRVRLGELRVTPAEIAARLGIPEAEIRKQLQVELQLGNLNISDVEFVGDRAVIRGTPN